jgi:hypothetical protein
MDYSDIDSDDGNGDKFWNDEGWMGTRRMIQQNSILWRLGYNPEGWQVHGTRQKLKRTLARASTIQSQRFDRSVQIPAIVGKYGMLRHYVAGNRAQWITRLWAPRP